MAVMIKGIKMPSNCLDCRFYSDYNGENRCDFTHEAIDETEYARASHCPLVKIEEPKTGHWVDDEVDSFSKSFGYKKFHCSNCNSTFSGTNVEKTDYCPNCGADMSEVMKNDKRRSNKVCKLFKK